MHSVKKSLSSDNKENEERTSSDQEFQRLLKGLSKKCQETKRSENRHKHFLSARDEKRQKQSAATKKKKHRK